MAAARYREPRVNIADLGYPDRPHGYYDATGDGFPTDYGRFVGPSRYRNVVWWAVAVEETALVPEGGLHGREYTEPGVFEQPSDEVLVSLERAVDACHAMQLTEGQRARMAEYRRPRANIKDLGYSNRPRGYYDATGDGMPTDYGRYVGPNTEHPLVWWAVAVANDALVDAQGLYGSEYTKPGSFAEPRGVRLFSHEEAQRDCCELQLSVITVRTEAVEAVEADAEQDQEFWNVSCASMAGEVILSELMASGETLGELRRCVEVACRCGPGYLKLVSADARLIDGADHLLLTEVEALRPKAAL